MNALANIAPSSALAVRQRRKPNPTEALLDVIERQHLAPFQQARSVVTCAQEWITGDLCSLSSNVWFVGLPKGNEGAVDEATRRVDILGQQEALLTDAIKSIGAALTMEPNREDIRPIVAVMLNAFPNARPHSPEGYYEALVSDIVGEGYSAVVAADGCQKIRRNSTFCPVIAEVLQCCASSRLSLAQAVKTARRGLDLLNEARAVVAIGIIAPEIWIPPVANSRGPSI